MTTAGMLALLPTSQNDPFGAWRSGRRLEFLQLRSFDRSASVSSSFPPPTSLGGPPVLPMMSRDSKPALGAINRS